MSYPFSVATHSKLSIAKKVTLRKGRKKIENNIFHFRLSLNALSTLLFLKNPGGKRKQKKTVPFQKYKKTTEKIKYTLDISMIVMYWKVKKASKNTMKSTHTITVPFFNVHKKNLWEQNTKLKKNQKRIFFHEADRYKLSTTDFTIVLMKVWQENTLINVGKVNMGHHNSFFLF